MIVDRIPCSGHGMGVVQIGTVEGRKSVTGGLFVTFVDNIRVLSFSDRSTGGCPVSCCAFGGVVRRAPDVRGLRSRVGACQTTRVLRLLNADISGGGLDFLATRGSPLDGASTRRVLSVVGTSLGGCGLLLSTFVYCERHGTMEGLQLGIGGRLNVAGRRMGTCGVCVGVPSDLQPFVGDCGGRRRRGRWGFRVFLFF